MEEREREGKICGIYQLSICLVRTMREKWRGEILIKYMFGSQGEGIDFKPKLLFVEPKLVLNNASEVLLITKY